MPSETNSRASFTNLLYSSLKVDSQDYPSQDEHADTSAVPWVGGSKVSDKSVLSAALPSPKKLRWVFVLFEEVILVFL